MEMRNRGFSVVEMMTVLGIIGILAGIAIPAYRGYIPRVRLTCAKDEVLVTLRLARAKALSERQIYQVIFEEATNAYRLSPGGQSTPLPQGIDIVNGADVTYEFRPDRTATMTPGAVALQNRKSQSVIFQVVAATGHIQVQ